MYDELTMERGAIGGLQAQNACLRMPSLREATARQLEEARKEVSRLEELVGLLDQNPETQRILELIGRKY